MNKQIDEMARVMCGQDKDCLLCPVQSPCLMRNCAHLLYAEGYRKASEEGAECPTCHGTGRIGTTDWLTKNISKEQLAKEKEESAKEYARNIRTEAITQFAKRLITYFDALKSGLVSYHIKQIEKEFKEKNNER